MELKNRGVLVTGGASGLGAACVRLLAQAGAKVVIADLNSEIGETLAAELRGEGAGVFFACANVASEESLKAAVQTTIEKCGGVHVLINCAGIAVIEKILGKAGPHSLESFQRVINVNLIGTFNAIRLAAAAMAENKPTEEGERGVIINTASIAAFDGQIGQAAYSASKGGRRSTPSSQPAFSHQSSYSLLLNVCHPADHFQRKQDHNIAREDFS